MPTGKKTDSTIVVAVIGLIGVIITTVIAPVIVPLITEWLRTTLAPTTVAIATPTSQPSITPSSTSPPIPSITRTGTKPAPTSTRTPVIPAATPCGTTIGAHFDDAKAKIASKGCPKEPERPINYAIQQFENGWMFDDYLSSHTVYVLFDAPNRTWKESIENWDRSNPEDSCKQISVAPPRVKPIHGFGQVWCGIYPSGLSFTERTVLGEGKFVEFSDIIYSQQFEDKRILLLGGVELQKQYVSVSGTVIFILFRDGSWDMVIRP